jgi:hypothetical protein
MKGSAQRLAGARAQYLEPIQCPSAEGFDLALAICQGEPVPPSKVPRGGAGKPKQRSFASRKAGIRRKLKAGKIARLLHWLRCSGSNYKTVAAKAHYWTRVRVFELCRSMIDARAHRRHAETRTHGHPPRTGPRSRDSSTISRVASLTSSSFAEALESRPSINALSSSRVRCEAGSLVAMGRSFAGLCQARVVNRSHSCKGCTPPNSQQV